MVGAVARSVRGVQQAHQLLGQLAEVASGRRRARHHERVRGRGWRRLEVAHLVAEALPLERVGPLAEVLADGVLVRLEDRRAEGLGARSLDQRSSMSTPVGRPSASMPAVTRPVESAPLAPAGAALDAELRTEPKARAYLCSSSRSRIMLWSIGSPVRGAAAVSGTLPRATRRQTRRCGIGLRCRRRSATNIASVPWRCGHSWTVPGSGPSQSGTSSSRVPASSRRTSDRPAQHRRHDAGGLGEDRRAGRVDHRPARAARRPGRRTAGPAGAAPGRRGRPGCAATAPPGGAAAPPGRCRARRPGPGRRHPSDQAGRVPSAVTTPSTPPAPASARATSAARCGSRSAATSPAPWAAARPASSAALPPGRRTGPATGRRGRPPPPRPAPGRRAGSPRPARRRAPRATAGTAAGSPPSSTRP